MSNIHGLFSGNNKKDEDSSDEERENRFVGGISARGGGSGLAVEPTPGMEGGNGSGGGGGGGGARDSVFQLAEQANSGGADAAGEEEIRRTITMYREGFVVDDGPYRRLDDPANADFLKSLAMGRTPAELVESGGSNNNNNGNVTVGLVDKRQEDYVETFQSFSGTGTTLNDGATSTAANGSSIDASQLLSSSPQPLDTARPTTSIQVRLPNGQRKVLKLNLDVPVLQLATHIAPLLGVSSPSSTQFQLVSGFPPKPLEDLQATIEDAGLKGAQVQVKIV